MRLKLATKIAIVIIGIEILSVLGGVGMLFLARYLQTLLATTISEAVPSVLAEAGLGNILQRQKGAVAGYMLDNGNPRRLERLHEFQTQFKDQIALIRKTTHVSTEEAEILDKLEKTYTELVARRALPEWSGRQGETSAGGAG